MSFKCLNCLDDSKHPMGQLIDDSGLCSGCLTHKEKDSIDWNLRWQVLQNKCEIELVKNKNNTYDCLIPLNADAEDYFIVETALKLNLRPLLVYVNNYFGTDLSWENLQNLETYFDLDLITFNPNIFSYKEAIRTSLRKYDSIYWPYQALKTSYPVRLALDMKIPVILWGGFQATEQAGKFSHYDEVEMTGWSRVQHDLFSVNEQDFFGSGAQISDSEQFHYFYPTLRQSHKVLGLYLSNYIRWDPWKQNNDMTKYGFIPENSIYTFDRFERAGSSVFYSFHDLLRFEKYGYRKVRDHLSREIRHGRVTLSNAKILYEQYLLQQIEISSFFEWLGVTQSGKESFIKSRLTNSIDFIGGDIFKVQADIEINNGFFPEAKSPDLEFLSYHKGISI
jgi:hypothetical protein